MRVPVLVTVLEGVSAGVDKEDCVLLAVLEPVVVLVAVLEGVTAPVPELEGVTLAVFDAVIEGVNVGVTVPVEI